MRILIVDDEKLARERLIRMVDTLDGYEVAGIADSGSRASFQARTEKQRGQEYASHDGSIPERDSGTSWRLIW